MRLPSPKQLSQQAVVPLLLPENTLIAIHKRNVSIKASSKAKKKRKGPSNSEMTPQQTEQRV
jgi:hypothetical protein